MAARGQRYWKKRCDALWTKLVKHNGVCELCGKRPTARGLHAHHLIGRTNLRYRHDVYNGIALCASCHVFSDECSAHASTKSAAGFLEALESQWPERYKWLMEHRHDKRTYTVDYEQVYQDLMEMDVPVWGESPERRA